MAKRRFLGLLGFGTGVFAGSVLYRRSTAPPPRPGRRVLRRRLDGVVRRGLARGREAAAGRARRSRRPHAPVSDAARAGARRARLPRGRLPAPLGQALALLPRQVPLRDPARPAEPARRAHRGRPSREHAPDATRLAGPELGAVALAAAASLQSGLPVHDRSEGGEGIRHRETDRRARTRRANASAWSRTSSHRAERCSTRSRRCAAPASSCTRRSAWSTVRRAARTRSRGTPSGCARSFGQASSSAARKVPQNRMVEP